MADRKDVEAVVAGAVGGGGALLVGPGVGEDNGCVGNDCSGGVGDGSEDVGGGQLREGC